MPFEVIEHTADTGIRVWANNLPSLFSEAARATFAQITEPDRIEPEHIRQISIDGMDETDLLINMLRELLYLFIDEGVLVNRLDVESINDVTLSGRIEFQYYDPAKHDLHMEIKAVTYAGGDIVKTADGFEIIIIFDV